MVELVDTSDLKSDDHTVVRVQVPLGYRGTNQEIEFVPFYNFKTRYYKVAQPLCYSVVRHISLDTLTFFGQFALTGL